MASKIKPIRFKVHQKQEKFGNGDEASSFTIEVEEKKWWGWSHKAWVYRYEYSGSYEPYVKPHTFYSTKDFERAIKDVEMHYEIKRSWAVTSKTETNYIYEKNS